MIYHLFQSSFWKVVKIGKMSNLKSAVKSQTITTVAAIAEATTDLQHVSGKSNVVADALSRIDGSGAEAFNDVDGADASDEAPAYLCSAI